MHIENVIFLILSKIAYTKFSEGPNPPVPKRKPKRKKTEESVSLPEQDDRFFFIAGYTSGGAPYGVTWEEMGLEPWEELE